MMIKAEFNKETNGKFFATGDIHGSVDRIHSIGRFCEMNRTTTDDIMFLLGDVGINYYGNSRDRYHKDEMAKIPITFVCVRGNHEMRPSKVYTYKRLWKFGGPVYIEDDYPNIVWLEDGKEYEICGKRILAIGGAYSVDKGYRLNISTIYGGVHWFPDEQLSEEEMAQILPQLTGQHYDIVLTHTCPASWIPRELFLSGVDQKTVDNSTEDFLEKVKNSITFDKWLFGHYHGEKAVPEEKYEMLYNKIIQLE